MIEFDVGFVSVATDDKLPILAGVTLDSGCGLAVLLRTKNPFEESVFMAVQRFLQETGWHGSLRIRTDPEGTTISRAQKRAQRRVPLVTVF